MNLNLFIKPFSFELINPLKTSQGILKRKEGWLLQLKDAFGNVGWGEISPIATQEFKVVREILANLDHKTSKQFLEAKINEWPPSLGFGFGAALGELDCLVGNKAHQGWLNAPQSAILLPQDKSALSALDYSIRRLGKENSQLTFKCKVGIFSISNEQEIIKEIFKHLPDNGRLRLDANGGWTRAEANNWINHLSKEQRLEWIEQPLPPEDLEGLQELSKKIPIALDESLIEDPSLKRQWEGWQIRRPLWDGDPRILLKELKDGKSYQVISTGFETGIGSRWVHHLAALQVQGATPAAPGLAPGWSPDDSLFSKDPIKVWESA